MSDILLRVNNLSTWFETRYGTVRAVDDVSFEIRRGETFALLGESGCGKSMTSLSIMRLVPEPAGRVVAGEVWLEGHDLMGISEASMRQVRGRRIAMIFQEPMTSLNPVLTIGAQVIEPLRLHKGIRGSMAEKRAIELLDSVGISDPDRRFREYPHQLSGGMKQRAMIAMALAGGPDLLIADEPTTALDVTIQAQVLELLGRLQKDTGMAILLITHDLGVVSQMADSIAVMYAGQIVENADRQQFFNQPRHPYSQKLFESLPDMEKRDQALSVIKGAVPSLVRRFSGCRFTERCDFAWDRCREAMPDWQNVGPAQSVRCHLYDPQLDHRASTEVDEPLEDRSRKRSQQSHLEVKAEQLPVLAVRNLKVHFPIQSGLFKKVVGHVYAVDGVDLQIRQGRTLALVGESGCGKTTIGKAILQLTRPTEGSVALSGVELTVLKGEALRQRRKEFQIIFQDPFSSMNPRMTVSDIVQEGMISLGLISNADDRERRVDKLLVQVGLPPEAKYRYPHEFSGGQRQRICIARALAVAPRLIVCDEPTSALDISVQAQILNLLKELQVEMGLSYLFITHNLSVVAYLADEVAVMYLGRIVEQGTVAEVLQAPRHPYTQALLSAIPIIDDISKRELIRLKGDIPSPANPPSGCHFHTRCPQVTPRCHEYYPAKTALSDTHFVRCVLYEVAKEGGSRS